MFTPCVIPFTDNLMRLYQNKSVAVSSDNSTDALIKAVNWTGCFDLCSYLWELVRVGHARRKAGILQTDKKNSEIISPKVVLCL